MQIKPAPYYNNAQLAVKLSTAPFKMLVMGRGSGKTTIFAEEIIKYLENMPRGKVAFGGLTYFHVRTRSMPAIIDFWEQRGLYRNAHYFIGHKAPKKFKWDEPFQPPLDYSNCIHFANGFVVEFVSFDRPETARSGSYDGMFFDEAAKLKKHALESDVLPANRGNNKRFEHIRFHHGIMFATTMPLTAEGEWVFNYEDLHHQEPENYMYMEASAQVNKHILGERYFRDQRRALPELIYNIEIENQRPNSYINSFYPKLGEQHLYYDSYNYSFVDNLEYDIIRKGSFDSRCDEDCNPNKPLDMSWDFGSRINCCIIAQEHFDKNEYRIIKNFYKENDTFNPVIEEFVKYYKYHKRRIIYLYGGSDGMKRVANSKKTYMEDVMELLTKAKWEVYLMAKFHEILHMDKFRFYNKMLTEDHPHLPFLRINQNNAYETYFSMTRAPIDAAEIKKNKRSERDENLPQWKATHLSDAVDNVVYWKFFQLLQSQGGSYEVEFLR